MHHSLTTGLKTGAALALLAGSLLSAHPAFAAPNLVRDGDFEQADPGAAPNTFDQGFTLANPFDTSWVITTGEAGIDTQDEYVYAGNKDLDLTPATSGTTTIAQNLATTPGQTYTLSFVANADAGSNLIDVHFGGTEVSGAPIAVPQNGYPNSGANSNAALFTPFSYQVTANSAFSGLTFSALNDGQNDIQLDNISVTANPVPEASSVVSLGLLLTLGLGGMVIARRKSVKA